MNSRNVLYLSSAHSPPAMQLRDACAEVLKGLEGQPMKVEFQTDQENNLVRVRIMGRCSFRDFGRFFLRLLDLKAEPDLRILTDIREAELSEGSFNGVSKVERHADRFINAYLPVRQAILVNSAMNFGIARMYETLAEKDGYEVHVFDDKTQAEAWLASNWSFTNRLPSG